MAKLTEAQYKEKYEKEKNDLKLLSERKNWLNKKRNLARISVANITSYDYGCFAVVKL